MLRLRLAYQSCPWCARHNKIDLNRWDNGKVICEMMEPIDTSSYTKDNVRELASYCHDLMEKRIAELDAEIAQGK